MQQVCNKTLKLSGVAKLVLGGVVLGVLAGRVEALSYRYVTDVAPGSSVPAGTVINVYLEEILGSGETSVIAAEGGLFGAGFGVKYNSTSPGSLSLISVSPNVVDFDGPSSLLDNSTATQRGVIESVAETRSTGPVPSFYRTDSGLTYNRLLLGTVQLDSSLTGGIAVFTLGAFSDYVGNITTFAGTDLDSQVATTDFAVIGTVPEPTGAGLAFVAVGALGLKRRR